MRRVFVNRFFFPDHSATSQMLADLCFGLAVLGHEVYVVTSRLRYEDPRARLAPEEEVAGVKVHRVWTSRFGRGTLPGRALDYFDPFVARIPKMREHGALAGRRSIRWLRARIRGYDAALIRTDHEGPDYGELVRMSRLVADTRNATRGVRGGSSKIVKA